MVRDLSRRGGGHTSIVTDTPENVRIYFGNVAYPADIAAATEVDIAVQTAGKTATESAVTSAPQ